ncbi:MAG: FkbM family methyltransferase [Gammaproteobacteria bacterium]|nr:FkbM family methyltransferase [Gammaproteobacteria bacterium]
MKLHKRIARSFGYELIKRKKHPTPETHLINLITLYNINLVLDVGANQGQFGRKLREEGYLGVIHSFEPASSTFNILDSATSADPNWHAHQCALGEEIGELELNIMESSDLSSMLPPNQFGAEKYQKIKVLRTETVPVDTVDNFLSKTLQDKGKNRILLKMDTQGFDLSVFKGATASLKKIIAIQSEISITPIYSGMPHYLDSLKLYEAAGFSITGMYPISRKHDMTVIEMDCMMLNNSHLEC